MALKVVPGVEHVEIGDWQQGTAVLIASSDVSEDLAMAAVAKAGYRAVVERTRYSLEEGRQVSTTQGTEFGTRNKGVGYLKLI